MIRKGPDRAALAEGGVVADRTRWAADGIEQVTPTTHRIPAGLMIVLAAILPTVKMVMRLVLTLLIALALRATS
jgi:hypothetical protein